MSSSNITTKLPPEILSKILRQVHDDEGPQWVELHRPHNDEYFLVCATEPAPLLRVCQATRSVMIFSNLTLALRAKNNNGPVLLTKFNYEQDTLFLDLGYDSLFKPMSLRLLLSAVPSNNIRRIKSLAISYYAARQPPQLENHATNFITELEIFTALESLQIVRCGSLSTDPVMEVLGEILSQEELGHRINTIAEDLGTTEPELENWLRQVEQYARQKSIAVSVIARD